MKPYGNKGGGSGVLAYETERDAIVIRFTKGTYRYTHEKPGRFEVEKMKRLAESGKGLASYISRFVGERYAEKL
jgi:hypothetical protein